MSYLIYAAYKKQYYEKYILLKVNRKEIK